MTRVQGCVSENCDAGGGTGWWKRRKWLWICPHKRAPDSLCAAEQAGRTCVDAPLNASFFFGQVPACDQMLSCVRPHSAAFTRRGPVWRCADWDQIAHPHFHSASSGSWFSQSRIYHRLPLPVLRSAHIPDTTRMTTALRGRHRIPINATLCHQSQAIRAILFASATATSIIGFRAIILASHDLSEARRRAAQRTTAIAPVLINPLKSRWPIFDVRPKRSFPPDDRAQDQGREVRGGQKPR